MHMDIKRGMLSMAIGILVILGVTGFLGWMMLNAFLDIVHMDLMAAGVLILGSGAAAMCCGRGEGRVRRIVITEIGLALFLSLLNLLLYDGNLSALIPCLLLIAGTAGAVILAGYGKTVNGYGKDRRKKQAIGKLNKKYSR